MAGKDKPAQAVIVQAAGGDKCALLDAALTQAGFWPTLSVARRRRPAAEFSICIVPDMDAFDRDAPTGTDPVLVEHLVDRLHVRGYLSVSVGVSSGGASAWLENRDALALADTLGYHFVAPGGGDYDVVDLGDDLTPVCFPPGAVLLGTELAAAWVNADFRIVFAKNKTHEEWGYALCLAALFSVLPCRVPFQSEEVCAELLAQTPAHFSLIDAWESSDGQAGARVPHPIATRAVIASENLLLADWAGAVKMGADPFVSPLNAHALRQIGLPEPYEIVGNVTPYADWQNVHPLVLDSARRRESSLSHRLHPFFQPVNADLFPFKDALEARVNAVAARLSSDAPWAQVGVNYALAAAQEWATAWRTMGNKDKLRWQERALNLDAAEFGLEEYEAVENYLTPLEALIEQTPADKTGLRWRYLDNSVLFECARTLPIAFDDFAARVDIRKSIQFMNDYIGGVSVPVQRDENGRVTHQAERNLYLPQPNFLVLAGGDVIDVVKLEFIRYEESQQKIVWKTVKSPNHSALYDDGTVTFARTENGDTHIIIRGRQQFTLPLFWQAMNLDLNPTVKNALVAHAYHNFFNQTLVNFEAAYEGREFRIGQPAKPDANAEKTLTEQAAELAEWANAAARKIPGVAALLTTAVQKETVTDGDGFVHVMGTPDKHEDKRATDTAETVKNATCAVRGFWRDMTQAARRDWGMEREDGTQ